MNAYELKPNDNRKSFYGKALIIHRNGEIILQSYNTEVCKIIPGGAFVRMWGGYSATTMRHVNAFLDCFGIPGGGKAWWMQQPVQN